MVLQDYSGFMAFRGPYRANEVLCGVMKHGRLCDFTVEVSKRKTGTYRIVWRLKP